MSAKRFALVSFGILCLSLSALIGFHAGGRSAVAQEQDFTAGFRFQYTSGVHQYVVMLPNGDVYLQGGGDQFPGAPHYLGNFWTGGQPISTSPSTLGNVKNKYGGNE